MAQVKHFAVYNQETNRNTPADDVIISQRAEHEIYFPAFWAATKQAHASSVMCSYSTINGQYACQNGDTPSRFKPLRIITMMKTPTSVPIMEPRPP